MAPVKVELPHRNARKLVRSAIGKVSLASAAQGPLWVESGHRSRGDGADLTVQDWVVPLATFAEQARRTSIVTQDRGDSLGCFQTDGGRPCGFGPPKLSIPFAGARSDLSVVEERE